MISWEVCSFTQQYTSKKHPSTWLPQLLLLALLLLSRAPASLVSVFWGSGRKNPVSKSLGNHLSREDES